jgi:hypothetical protein
MSLMMGGVDKVILGTAATFGLREELNLVGQQYSWASSLSESGVLLTWIFLTGSLLWIHVDSLSANVAMPETSYREGMTPFFQILDSLLTYRSSP